MAGTKDRSSNKKKGDPIFRKRTFIILAALLTVFLVSLVFYDELKLVCRMLVGDLMYKRIARQEFSALYEIQINLLFTAISTLAIITSFMEQRYLGASYKYWLFKNSPYLLMPQESILLMAVNQIGGLLHVLTGGYKIILFLSFLISWYLFLYLCYQMYIHVIKISYMFQKVKRQLMHKNKLHTWDTRCEEIYKKVILNQYADKENSYWAEEAELILQVMIMYRDYYLKNTSSIEIRKLKNAIKRLVKNEAYVRCGLYEHLNNPQKTLTKEQKETVKEFYRVFVRKIVDKGNQLIKDNNRRKSRNDNRSYTYCEAKTPAKNLDKAFSIWYDAIN